MLEKALIKRAARGDRKAFETLWRKYLFVVSGVALRVTRRVDDQEEVIQETAIILWRKLKNFKFQSEYRSWLHRVTFNAALMLLRNKKRIKEISWEDETLREMIEPHASEVDDPFKRVHSKQIKRRILTSLSLVEHTDARRFMLHHGDEIGNNELAAMDSISISAVKSRMHRTKRIVCDDMLYQFGKDNLVEMLPACVNL